MIKLQNPVILCPCTHYEFSQFSHLEKETITVSTLEHTLKEDKTACKVLSIESGT